MSKKIETYIVDSFTDQAFKGNPAGVCVLDTPLSDEKMQTIARELGLSETAFVKPITGKEAFSIRYFSPKMEIPLCGHATLASAKVLFEIESEMDRIHFQNLDGLDLLIVKDREIIEMEFPVYSTSPQGAPDELLRALGIKVLVNSAFNRETNILLLEIESSSVLEGLAPDFEKLKRAHDSINGVLVTAPSQRTDYDFESRYFWPWSGTNEDPVTGGTHTFLAKYWGERLNKYKMRSYQCSARSGFMEVELVSGSKLLIRSEAQIVLKGEMRV
ncbi:PhzF family phenazine biosynthesis isomerase [Cryomorphaceae bacterium 1068]|nr:PhzF family phenazine biosynthesis isomerase [Cryomorphaceae bacterium 1068]